MDSANVFCDILATLIREVVEGTKPKGNEFVVERVELAEGRYMECSSQKRNVAFKGTGAGNQAANQVGPLSAVDFDLINPLAHRSQDIKDRMTSGIKVAVAQDCHSRGGDRWEERAG